MKKAVFLDRDGIINKSIFIDGRPFAPRKFEQFELIDGIKELLEKFRKNEFLNIIVTNQPDIARKLLDKQVIQKIDDFIYKNLPIDDIIVCPHDNQDNCSCRKPKPGMLISAAEKWNINLQKSFMIGDQWKDIDAGKNAGCTTILLDYPYNKQVDTDYRVSNFEEIKRIIINSHF